MTMTDPRIAPLAAALELAMSGKHVVPPGLRSEFGLPPIWEPLAAAILAALDGWTLTRTTSASVQLDEIAARYEADTAAINARIAVLTGAAGAYREASQGAIELLRRDNDFQQQEIARLIVERDLALVHDTQPYPTAWAYEKACQDRDEAKAEQDRLRRIEEAARAYLNTDDLLRDADLPLAQNEVWGLNELRVNQRAALRAALAQPKEATDGQS